MHCRLPVVPDGMQLCGHEWASLRRCGRALHGTGAPLHGRCPSAWDLPIDDGDDMRCWIWRRGRSPCSAGRCLDLSAPSFPKATCPAVAAAYPDRTTTDDTPAGEILYSLMVLGEDRMTTEPQLHSFSGEE